MRGRMALAPIIGCLYILIIPAFLFERSSMTELDAVRTKLKELSSLGSEYRSVRARVAEVEHKGSSAATGGVTQAIDVITSSAGIKGKTRSIKIIGSREIRDSLIEESAELQMEKVTMNELVNIFYGINNGPFMFSIKKASIKKTFENPELLDMSMTVALFTKK